MRRRLVLLLILLFVVAAQITLGQEKAPNVTGLQLEKVVVYSSCASDANTICSGDEAKLHITTEIDDDYDLGFLTYAYTVGAGKISGKGAKVIWGLRESAREITR